MSATIIRFPQRHRFSIVIQWDADDGWYVLRGSHGWLHGDITHAFADAQEMANADSVNVVVRS
jgi:hypothetical protein